ncbi:PA2169 family four-helix-bundle protein [Hymenobacter caeli]|uniref:Uncharacterized protein (TIGR02284 family) n=1 Tax=Hymenobacter caeli TaxID=2735894 RepID=A0ABX2FQT5_9BACT|nr:PA2169 family four-helix-bundle protein [Hymenobacter caeli]NRT19525.1 uncharacterized protein (TIGR02284 family) [Hymenobacter caeli]
MATLADNTARAYNDLVTINETSTKGYQEAAEGVTSPELKAQLARLSEQRAQYASALSQHAQQFGIPAGHETTVEGALTDAAAAVHRGWINIKSAVTGQSDAAILGECETGDAAALKAYETALQSNDLPTEAKTVLQKQHDEILSAKNQVTQWKGQAK